MITIKQIKQATKYKYLNLFTNKTLRFFGQSLDSFKVYEDKQYKAVIIAPIFSRLGDAMGYFIRGFTGSDLVELSTAKQAEIIKQYKNDTKEIL